MNLINRYILGIPMTDATHTFRVFKKDIFNSVANNINEKRSSQLSDSVYFLGFPEKYKITEIPISFKERGEEQGVSKLSIKREIIPFIKLVLRLVLLLESQ